jgi:hypothetical protein
VGIAPSIEELGGFETVDHCSDSTGGETDLFGQLTRGHLTEPVDHVQTSTVTAVNSEEIAERLVHHVARHLRRAQGVHELPCGFGPLLS